MEPVAPDFSDIPQFFFKAPDDRLALGSTPGGYTTGVRGRGDAAPHYLKTRTRRSHAAAYNG